LNPLKFVHYYCSFEYLRITYSQTYRLINRDDIKAKALSDTLIAWYFSPKEKNVLPFKMRLE